MSEEEFRTDNLNNKNEKPESENQVDNFPKTTKLLDTKLKEKKDKILTVLKNDELKKLFEEALSSPEKRQKLINELLENDNTEGVIFANLPE
jgi:actin-related protein